jgi:hypothetical protein
VVERLVGTRLLREILAPGLLRLWNILVLDNWRRLLWHRCLGNIGLHISCNGLWLIRSVRLHRRWLWGRLRWLKHRLLRTLLLLLLLLLLMLLMLLLLLPLKILRASIAIVSI